MKDDQAKETNQKENQERIALQNEKEAIRQAFSAYDEDKSGEIDINELQSLVEDLAGAKLQPEELQGALGILDKDASGKIDFAEFESWWLNKSDDLDGDGSVNNIEQALKKLKKAGQARFQTDIHTACWRGDLDVVVHLLDCPANVVSDCDRTEFGDMNTPLHYAAYQGHEKICSILIDKGANPSAQNCSGCTPLFFAAQQEHCSVVNLLLKSGADARICEKEKKLSAVDVSCSSSIIDCFKQMPGKSPAAPLSISAALATPFTLEVSWKAPKQQVGEHSPICTYKIKYYENGSDEFFVISTSASVNKIVLEDLKPCTKYIIQVCAVNLQGDGPYSSPYTCSTKKEPPSPPCNIQVSAISSDCVEVTWDQNSDDKTAIEKYIIEMSTGKELLWRIVKSVGGDTKEANIENLFPLRKYNFRLAAQNKNGQGRFSRMVGVTTPDGIQTKVKRKIKSALVFKQSIMKSDEQILYSTSQETHDTTVAAGVKESRLHKIYNESKNSGNYCSSDEDDKFIYYNDTDESSLSNSDIDDDHK